MKNMHLEVLLPLGIFLYCLFCMTRKGSRLVVSWPLVGMLPTLFANSNRILDHVTDMLREFNHTMVFRGPWFCNMNIIFTCDPENANHMYNLHFDNYPKGNDMSEIFDVLGDGIFSVDGDAWMTQRRITQSHMNQPTFKCSVAACTKSKTEDVLLPLLNDMAELNKVVDLSDVFMRFTFDTTCNLVLGVDPGCLAAEFPSIPFAVAMDIGEQVLLYRHLVPKPWWKLMRVLRLGMERKMTEALKVVDSFVGQHLLERREKQKVYDDDQELDDMISPYLEADYPDKFLKDVALTFMAAGKDTTGTALVWFFWLLANNPLVEEKILEELKDLRRCSRDDEMTGFDAEEIDGLVYLHAAVCETLRLYPPVPFNHKQAQKADVLPSGHKLRPGMKIYICSYSMGRMEAVWGKDCLKFRPERWITEKGTLRHEPSYKFIAFHSGPRSCLGKRMALTQIKLVTAVLIYNFEVKVVEGHVTEPKPSVVIQAKNGLPVRLKRRKLNTA